MPTEPVCPFDCDCERIQQRDVVRDKETGLLRFEPKGIAVACKVMREQGGKDAQGRTD